MSSTTIVQGVQRVLGVAFPNATVIFGMPKRVNDDIVIYFWYDGYQDVKKTNSTIQRHHTINIHLLINASADDVQAELTLLTYTDVLADLFYTNHELFGASTNVTTHQRDAAGGGSSLAYIVYDHAEYRFRRWSLDVTDNHGYAMS